MTALEAVFLRIPFKTVHLIIMIPSLLTAQPHQTSMTEFCRLAVTYAPFVSVNGANFQISIVLFCCMLRITI